MFSFLKKRIFPIGVDMGSDALKVAQLGCDKKGIFIVTAASEKVPEYLEAGSSDWQRWMADALKRLTCNGAFSGRDVVTAIPAEDVFVEQIKIPKRPEQKLDEAVLANIQEKIPFDAADAMVKYVVSNNESVENKSGQVDVLVMAAERIKVERHLAIYENANLEAKQVGAWPLALVNSYIKFFGRRASDQDKVAMLIQIGANFTNIVICRGSNPLFARLIPIGLKKLSGAEMADRLTLELSACDHYFESLSGLNRIDRLIYLSSNNSGKNICENLAKLAQRWQVPAQLGNVVGAIEVRPGLSNGFDRRDCKVNWATAFGLSLF